MAELHDLSVTDANNIGRFPESQAPSTLNNGARALEGIIARYTKDMDGSLEATVSGSVIQITTNRVSITSSTSSSNYIDNIALFFQMGGTASPGPCSVNLNGIGAKPLLDSTSQSLGASVLPSGALVGIHYDRTLGAFRVSHGTEPREKTTTFTPTITIGGSSTGITYSAQNGRYVRIGNLVWVDIRIVLSSKNSLTGDVVVASLPYQYANSQGVSTARLTALVSGATVSTAYWCELQRNTTNGIIEYINGSGALTDVDGANITDTSTIHVSGCYYTTDDFA